MSNHLKHIPPCDKRRTEVKYLTWVSLVCHMWLWTTHVPLTHLPQQKTPSENGTTGTVLFEPRPGSPHRLAVCAGWRAEGCRGISAVALGTVWVRMCQRSSLVWEVMTPDGRAGLLPALPALLPRSDRRLLRLCPGGQAEGRVVASRAEGRDRRKDSVSVKALPTSRPSPSTFRNCAACFRQASKPS
ncbi:hypothetical protein ANANG_G00057460 [Anguilla anguilla]|uniref:Uncharacterized protein n=1 Tax=Anguilla anguilla TaxID=7936 RepID=A0A9D3S1M9_ANGAN|nr:hypothetical protein ANANG_G00057460 [Anguilla anguilla]